jgi:hypothetical protein
MCLTIKRSKAVAKKLAILQKQRDALYRKELEVIKADKKPLITKKPIRVYKHVLKVPVWDHAFSKSSVSLKTPYRRVEVKLGTLMRSRKLRACGGKWKYGVNEGIHAWRNLDRLLIGEHYIISTIPKGTEYFIGECGDIVSQYLQLGNECKTKGNKITCG